MEPTSTDWGGWPTGQNDIDEMIDAYKQEDLSPTIRNGNGLEGDDITDKEYSLYDENMSASETECSADEEKNMKTSSTVTNSSYFMPSLGEGMGTCEFCGRVGVKHAFYSKSKRFCTLGCSRSYSASQKEKGKNMHKKKTKKIKPQSSEGESFNWAQSLNESQGMAAPVSSFKHVPMADSWENITIGMKVEVLNSDCDLPRDVYWIATVIKIAGYKAHMRYEGFSTDFSKDFWINLCTQDVHPVGWCATMGKSLVPPQTIQHKYSDWKDFLVKRLTGARTLPQNFYNKVQENIYDHPIKPGMKVEVVDKMCVSAMRVATVEDIVGGRLHLLYDDTKQTEIQDDFWCHRESPLVHPVGWAQSVGHKLHATGDYRTKSYNKRLNDQYADEDTSPDMFVEPPDAPTMARGTGFQIGMKLEAIDPLNLSCICVATVMKVLKNNYLMIGIDGSVAENGSDWFCFHSTSPCIFPVGFCEINNIKLTPPRGYAGEFKWLNYLKATKSTAAPVKLFDKEIPKHGFKCEMKLEAVDLMEPRLICVGTVVRVVGRLLRVHFDGWESSYDQWVDCQSPDIYPVGWCEMTSFHLEGPKPGDVQPVVIQGNIVPAKKRRCKNQVYRGPRKKKKVPTATLR